MAFGGFFGGGSNNDKDKDTSSTPSEFSPSSQAPPSPLFNPGSQSQNPFGASSASSNEIKTRLTTAISQQSNIMNAKALISRINENCFDHCVTSPGTSLSSKEQGCLSSCMEKYIEGWNVVSKSYVSRLQREQAAQGGLGGNGGGIF